MAVQEAQHVAVEGQTHGDTSLVSLRHACEHKKNNSSYALSLVCWPVQFSFIREEMCNSKCIVIDMSVLWFSNTLTQYHLFTGQQ